jgi:hypothetical protein
MTGRGWALLAAARRAVLTVPGLGGAHIVRDRRREDVPLGQQAAVLLEPESSQQLWWPESRDWLYELSAFSLVTVARVRPGATARQKVAELHEAALAAIQSSEEILAVVSDGPPSPEHVLRDLKKEIGGVRCGPTVEEKDRPGDPFALATTVCLGVWISQPTTSVTLDGAALFASGPHEIVLGSAERATGERLFNGLAGALLVDLGPRPRRLVQHGRLSAASETSLFQLESAIEARIDGAVHALVDRDGTNHPYVRVERFTRRGPVEIGLRYNRAYEVEYTDFLPGT